MLQRRGKLTLQLCQDCAVMVRIHTTSRTCLPWVNRLKSWGFEILEPYGCPVQA